MHFPECQQMSPEKPFATVLIASADLWRGVTGSKTVGEDDESHHGLRSNVKPLHVQQRDTTRHRDYVRDKNKLGCSHFHMIKQLAIWDVSSKVQFRAKSFPPRFSTLTSPHINVVCFVTSASFNLRLWIYRRRASVGLLALLFLRTQTFTRRRPLKRASTSLGVMRDAAGTVEPEGCQTRPGTGLKIIHMSEQHNCLWVFFWFDK